jgi:hypothetical protein
MTTATAVPEFTYDLWAESDFPADSATSMEPSQGRIAQRRMEGPERILCVTPDPRDAESPGSGRTKLYQTNAGCHQTGARSSTFNVLAFVPEQYPELLQIEGPCEAITASSLRRWLWQQPEVPPDLWRGVFAIKHQRRELFSLPLKLNLHALPRWTPQITLTRRMLDADDE